MQKRSSSLLHKWLTPAEFGSLFGPADADVAKVTGWLQGEGFSVNKMSLGKGTIDFSGTVGTINAAVHTQMHTYDRNGVTFHSNSSDPQIPAALQPVVAGLVSLNYIQPQSNMIVLGTAKLNLQTHQAIPVRLRGQWAICSRQLHPVCAGTGQSGRPVQPGERVQGRDVGPGRHCRRDERIEHRSGHRSELPHGLWAGESRKPAAGCHRRQRPGSEQCIP
jgi:hypothetical protein